MRLATVVWVVNPENKFLILRRALDDYWCAGQWGLPGGRVDAQESVLYGAIRETFEETGLKVKDLKLLLEDEYKDLNIHVSYYATRITENFPVQISNEHISYAWVTLKELEEFDCVPKLKDLSNKVLKEYLTDV